MDLMIFKWRMDNLNIFQTFLDIITLSAARQSNGNFTKI